MMEPVHRIDDTDASAFSGEVALDLSKVLWTGGMLVSFLLLAPFHTTPLAVLMGLALTYITLLLGHSVGMHRMMIHRAFTARPWLKRALIYIGVLVGIGGPRGIITIHDTRDWAQRGPNCHDYFSHRRGFLRDLTWQLFYRFNFSAPPRVKIEPDISEDAFLNWLDKTWRWHQLGLAIVLFLIGGLPFVIWGVCFRVALSTIGHWSVTWICHNPGPGSWDVKGAGVQASNLRFAGWLTHGECWHNNHHAFPESARIGLEPGQTDPAWWIIRIFERINLVSRVGLPRPEAARSDLVARPHFTDSQKYEKA